jgi:hypothetical protein
VEVGKVMETGRGWVKGMETLVVQQGMCRKMLGRGPR